MSNARFISRQGPDPAPFKAAEPALPPTAPTRLQDGRLEWTFPTPATGGKGESGRFERGTHKWYLAYETDGPSGSHLRISLHQMHAARPARIVSRLTLVNHKDSKQSIIKDGGATWVGFSKYAFPALLPSSLITEDAGWAKGGRLVVQLELLVVLREDSNTRPIKRLRPNPVEAGSVGCNLLSILDEADGTADLTIMAATGRAVRVHRAILAARCPFFRTLFANKDFADSAAKELPLPEADPEALKLLLRYMYGGVLEGCSRELLKPAILLADQLLLAEARAELCERLVEGVAARTLVDDLLWAEANNVADVLQVLEGTYVNGVEALPAEAAANVAEHGSKALLARLHAAVVRRLRERA